MYVCEKRTYDMVVVKKKTECTVLFVFQEFL